MKIDKKNISQNINEIKGNLTNHTEQVVLETMEELLIKEEDFKNICTCKRCLIDIASYVLNRLPARYIASHEGEVQTKIDEYQNQVQVDAISTVTKAIHVISKKPRH